MKSIIESLPSGDFIRVHRSFIIAIGQIVKIDGNLIEMESKVIPISRSYKDNVMKKINLIT